MRVLKNRLWRMFLLITVFQLLTVFIYANDWEFGSRGEHLIPLKNSDMKIKEERIVMKLEQGEEDFQMKVSVRFVFENSESGRKTIGFVTPESGNGFDDKEENSEKLEKLGITNFLTKVNGQVVNSKVKPLREMLSKGVLDKKGLE